MSTFGKFVTYPHVNPANLCIWVWYDLIFSSFQIMLNPFPRFPFVSFEVIHVLNNKFTDLPPHCPWAPQPVGNQQKRGAPRWFWCSEIFPSASWLFWVTNLRFFSAYRRGATGIGVHHVWLNPICEWNEKWMDERWTLSRWWFQTFFIFYPYLGKWSNLTNIFQVGWNPQPVVNIPGV